MTFYASLKKSYSHYFPELSKISSDNLSYAACVKIIGDRSGLSQSEFDDVQSVTNDLAMTEVILEAAKMSKEEFGKGYPTETKILANSILQVSNFLDTNDNFIKEQMQKVAPNLSAVAGEKVGSELIFQAGSLKNLAKGNLASSSIKKILLKDMNKK